MTTRAVAFLALIGGLLCAGGAIGFIAGGGHPVLGAFVGTLGAMFTGTSIGSIEVKK